MDKSLNFVSLSEEELKLSNGLSVTDVYTMSSKLGKNNLATFFEDFTVRTIVSSADAQKMVGSIQYPPFHHPPPKTLKNISFQVNTYIQYRRLNHQDFTFHVKIKNPSRQTKKVIIRIHLGLSDKG